MKRVSPHEWGRLMFGVTLALSILVRVFPGMLVSFPINDGGMFLVMARDLRQNGFVLPAFTTYNRAHIPFAYPPLGFYVTGTLSTLGLPELVIVQWLPIVLSCLAVIPAFHLAEAILKNRAQAAVATMLYALIPGSYDLGVMGGGLTRGFGLLFLRLAMYAAFRLFEAPSLRRALLTVAFCSLAVLSHPEAILATATGIALIWLFHGRTRGKILAGALVATGTLVLTAPWWASVLARHGTAPFLSAMQTGAHGASPFTSIFVGLFSPASLFTLRGLMRLAGILWGLRTRRYFLVAWVLLPYVVEPRSAPAVAAIPTAMLTGLLLTESLPRLYGWLRGRLQMPREARPFTEQRWFTASILLLMFGLFLASALHDFTVANTTLKGPEPMALMDWVIEGTAEDSEFVILSGNTGVATDPIQEWFPALTGRRSQTTSQGLEWTLGSGFLRRVSQLIELQRCQDLTCVEDWSAGTGLGYTHLLLERNELTRAMVASVEEDDAFNLIYENPRYLLYQAQDGDGAP